MIKTAFTCNSLKLKHLFLYLGKLLQFNNNMQLGEYLPSEISTYFDVPEERIFLFGSARMGLFTVLSSIKRSDEDEVIVAGYTCVVVTNAIKYADMKAIYIDINEMDLNIDRELLEKSINSKTRAVIITHNFGISCNYLKALKEKYTEIIFIEDVAHSIGSINSNGEKLGLTGDASFFSMEYSKPITTGMGGILIINNKEILPAIKDTYLQTGHYPPLTNFRIFISLKMHLLSSSRYTISFKRWLIGLLYVTGLLYRSSPSELMGEKPKYYPVKLSPDLSYIGYLQLRELESINKKKADQAAEYFRTFKGIDGIKQYYSTDYNYARYPVLFLDKIKQDTIQNILKELRAEGIYPGEWFNDVVHPRGSFRYGYSEGSCRIGESVSKRIINFPITIHKQLTTKDLKKIREIFIRNLSTLS